MFKSKAELGRVAEQTRRDLGMGPRDAFDFDAWSLDWGVPIVSLADLTVSDEARDHFLGVRREVWSAALIQHHNRPHVLFNASHSKERVRSSLGHEVAHVIAEHELSAEWVEGGGACAGSTRAQENEAAELGALLLVPQAVAKSYAIGNRSSFDLARQFEVSEALAEWRMRMSGGRRIAARSRRRWGRPDPAS